MGSLFHRILGGISAVGAYVALLDTSVIPPGKLKTAIGALAFVGALFTDTAKARAPKPTLFPGDVTPTDRPKR